MVNENFDFPDFVKKVKGVDYGIDGLFVHREHTPSGTIYFVKAQKEVKFPRHSHKAQFTSVLSGSCTLEINGECKTYKKGDTYIIPADTLYQITLHAGYAEMDYVDDPNDGEY